MIVAPQVTPNDTWPTRGVCWGRWRSRVVVQCPAGHHMHPLQVDASGKTNVTCQVTGCSWREGMQLVQLEGWTEPTP